MEKFIEAFQHIERPFAWLDYEALDQNIDFVNALATKPVRIATKSVRSVNVLKYIQRKLNNCAGFMTFTAAESIYLIEQGLDHLLLGYPTFEENSIKKLLAYSKEGKDITFMVDAIEQMELLQNCAASLQTTANICIDINISTDYKWIYFGTKRSPLDSIQKLKNLTDMLGDYPNVRIHAVMGYEAQLAGVPDLSHVASTKMRAKGVLIRRLKKQSLEKITAFRRLAVAHVKSIAALAFVNGGGSGSIAYTCAQKEITEITVGSAFFAPALFDDYDSLQLQPAVGFALRVTRQFDSHTFVCQGGGYIASGAIGEDRAPVFLNKQYQLLPLEGAGEVQTPFLDASASLKVGDTVYLRHAKAGELCERFAVLHCTRGKSYEGPILTYRGEQQCFL
ncbi:alanine racemase [Metasolibacillus meyeri]|uniref:Alanine racemase n=1 Tax=Metasolibacillus meyeri TaxID=1071052 RepID=A0AAW9NRE4_9BACL|nr:alanine racemase [Metasolibacillus meyeri]MEC1177331.1 alanine racemase [Metasolibacillus meyeri]